MMYNKNKKSSEMTTQFAHVYIERNASYRSPCSVFPASKNHDLEQDMCQDV